jgi:hypothetical protein
METTMASDLKPMRIVSLIGDSPPPTEDGRCPVCGGAAIPVAHISVTVFPALPIAPHWGWYQCERPLCPWESESGFGATQDEILAFIRAPGNAVTLRNEKVTVPTLPGIKEYQAMATPEQGGHDGK